MNCLGVPVVKNPDMTMMSIKLDRARWWWPWKFSEPRPVLIQSQGIWRWKKIVVGRDFSKFPIAEQQAMLLHEVGHVRLRHVEQRLRACWKIIFAPFSFSRLCTQQEFQADCYAANCGYGVELASALSRMKSDDGGAMHPYVGERVERLLAWRSKG